MLRGCPKSDILQAPATSAPAASVPDEASAAAPPSDVGVVDPAVPFVRVRAHEIPVTKDNAVGTNETVAANTNASPAASASAHASVVGERDKTTILPPMSVSS